MKYFACHEHVELAMEHIIDECEAAPAIEKVDNNSNLSTTCSFCTSPALYIVNT
ncbi:CxxH/CxxC protein [Bacillus alkalicellulosilyticus]|uniref:CxxH/CxxC protein n=1 Tax=Alkalihalobacterium alkalicellulosilyticum TaxID=1912214 RepID=UPI000997DE4C|nr:CxxH/CxxC protein [Bacillus alkalicellulosilyticus]